MFLGIDPGNNDVEGYYVDENGNEFDDLVENVSVTSGDFVKVDLTLQPVKK